MTAYFECFLTHDVQGGAAVSPRGHVCHVFRAAAVSVPDVPRPHLLPLPPLPGPRPRPRPALAPRPGLAAAAEVAVAAVE